MSESIQAPKKRTYTRKPKVVEPIAEPLVNSDSDQSTTSTDSGLVPPPPQKPKRVYKKKVAISEPVEEIPSPTTSPVLERQTNEPDSSVVCGGTHEEVPSSVEDKGSSFKTTMGENGVSPLKKPRTEKQQEAFRKMREARLKKTEELKKLKELEKEQKQLEKEQTKLNTITEKVVEKAAAIKQRKSRKSAAETFDVLPEPQYVPQIIQEKTIKPYIFV